MKQAEDSPPSKTRILIHIDHMPVIGDCWDIFSETKDIISNRVLVHIHIHVPSYLLRNFLEESV